MAEEAKRRVKVTNDCCERRIALDEAHHALWQALAEIIECPGQNPNATVRRMAAIAERALIEDTVADFKPVPRFYAIASHGGQHE